MGKTKQKVLSSALRPVLAIQWNFVLQALGVNNPHILIREVEQQI